MLTTLGDWLQTVTQKKGNIEMNNIRIKIAMTQYGIKQWELARIMGLHEGSLSRKFRVDLSEEEQNRIVELIRQHAKQTGGNP